MTKEFRENEIEDLHIAISHTSNRRGAIDVGANVGVWTKVLAENFENVMAIEPVQKFYDKLYINTQDLPNVIIHPHAVGNRRIKVEMKEKKQAARVVGEGHPDSSIEVNLLDLMWKPPVYHGPVDLIKTDCEGYDLNVLIGAQALIRKDRPTLIVEYHLLEQYEQNEDTLYRFLKNMDYRVIYRVWPNLIALHKSSRYY